MAAADEPLVLPVGTEVSAKYRGAFCEAKVKKIVRIVKCKVNVAEPKQQITVQDEDIKGVLKVGSKVEVKLSDLGQYAEATISKLTDCSQYTVVFDDGDENTLRRTQLCLKGEKHFVKSETLDQLPLTHPEHFGTPVMKGYKGQKRRRSGQPGGASVSESESESESSECSSPRKKVYKGRLHDQIGRVLCMEIEDRKKTIWVPVLVVLPGATDMELKTRDHLLVKSFKDGKFYSIMKRETKEFVRDMAVKNEDKVLKPAMEKALAYFDTRDLPSNWDREELLGEDSEDEDESDTSDDEPSEEKDHFVAQLYKFMDDRGTPINKAPSIGSQDLNLYRLFKLVRNLGGYNKVTNLMKWKLVYSKMNLPPSSNAYNQIRTAYKKFLHAYEDFYRKLGSTMGSARPGRTRTTGRNLLPFREREAGQPKSPRSDKKKDEKDTEESDDDDKGKGKDAEKSSEGKGKKEEKKAGVKEEADDTDSPRKRRSRAVAEKKAEEKKKEEEREEKVTKRMTREDTAKLKEESKVKAEEERTRRSTSKKAEPEVEEKEDVGQKRKSTRKKTAKEEEQKKKEKEEPVSDGGPDEDSDDGEEEEPPPPPPPPKEETSGRKVGKRELAIGSRLKVRYGRGRNQKIYEAKVIESEQEGNYTHYLVHYAGWNTRYDEWVQRDRIVAIVSDGNEADRKSIGNKTLKSPKSVVKKKQGPKTPTSAAATPKTDPAKTPKAKTPTPSATPNQKSRPTRSSGQEPTPVVLPTRKSRRHGTATEETSSDVQSHVSYSESEDESISDDKKMDTDDTDSLKTKSDRSSDTTKPKNYTKTAKGPNKKQEKETDVSESESESFESVGRETKPRGKGEKGQTPKLKTDLKNEMSMEKEEDKVEEALEMGQKFGGKGATTQARAGKVKAGPNAEEPCLEMATIMDNKAKDLMCKDEDAQSEDDIIKDLKHNHHIDMGDILMDSDTDMPIATPKAKPSKDGGKGGKRRKSSDSADKLCGRQDSMDTVAYGYDLHIQDAVENILQQLDEGDDDSDDLSFLTPTKEPKDVFQKLETEKKEDIKSKKEKKTAEKVKEKGEKTPKSKGKKKEKVNAATPAANTTTTEIKPESEGEKTKKPEVEKIKKKKKVKKKLEVKDPEKDVSVASPSTDKKDKKEKSELKGESEDLSVSMSEDAPPPPQLNLVTPTKEKEDLSKSDGLEMSPAPPKLQAERLDLEPEDKKEEKSSTVSTDVTPVNVTPVKPLPAHQEQDPKSQQEPSVNLPAPEFPSPSKSAISSFSPSSVQPEPSLPAPTAIISAVPTSSSSLPSSVLSTPHPSSLGSPAKDAEHTQKLLNLTPQHPTSPKQAPVPLSQPSPSPSLPSQQPLVAMSTTTTSTTASPAVSSSSPAPSTSVSPSKPQSSNSNLAAAAAVAASSGGASKQSLPVTPLSQQSVFDNTPPETPEGSPEGSHVSDDSKSPIHTTESKPVAAAQPEAAKTEHAEGGGSFTALLPGAESPNTCDTSTISNGSEGSSSGNMPSSEDSTEGSVAAPTTTIEKKRKQPPPDEQNIQHKKRKRGSKRSTHDKGKSTPKHTMSDSDEGGEGTSASPKRAEVAPSSAAVPMTTTPNKKPGSAVSTPSATPGTSNQAVPSTELPRPQRTSNKYNLNLEEGEYLTGEKRISFLMEKLQEIRKIYMGLKAEVACIDRRKKRLKRREKEGTALALASLANS